MELIIRRQRPLETAAAWLRKQKLGYLCYLIFKRPRNLEHLVHEPAPTKTGGNLNRRKGRKRRSLHGLVYSTLRLGEIQTSTTKPEQKLCYFCSLLFKRPRNLEHPVQDPRRQRPGEFEQEEREETETHARLDAFKAQAWSIQTSITMPKQKICHLCYLLFNRRRNLNHPARDPSPERPGGNLNTSEGKTCVGLDNVASGLVGSRQH